MNTDLENIEIPQDHVHHQTQTGGVLANVWHFVRHFIEMCLAMCIGGIPLIFIFFWGATQIGYPKLFEQSPKLSVLAIGIILSLVMTAWMRFRGMDWRLTLEMSSTTIILGVLLVVLGGIGVLPRSSLIEGMRNLACPVMLIPMLLRLDHYTGRMDHSMHSMHAMQ